MVLDCPGVHSSLCHGSHSLCQKMDTFPSFSVLPVFHTTPTLTCSHMHRDNSHPDPRSPMCTYLSGGRLLHTLGGTFT